VIDVVPKAQGDIIGMNDSYKMHRRSHVSNDNQQRQHRKPMKEGDKTHDTDVSDDAATVGMEMYTYTNWT
jgi:hypothetical protein